MGRLTWGILNLSTGPSQSDYQPLPLLMLVYVLIIVINGWLQRAREDSTVLYSFLLVELSTAASSHTQQHVAFPHS